VPLGSKYTVAYSLPSLSSVIKNRNMAKTSQIASAKKKPKFSSRLVRRCFKCGRRRGFMRAFGLCRICFRELANKGEIPGVTKSSW